MKINPSIPLVLILCASFMAGCGESDTESPEDEKTQASSSADPAASPSVPTPDSPQAAAMAALDDIIATLEKEDYRRFLEYHAPVKDLPQIRANMDAIIERLQSSKQDDLADLISFFKSARQGNVILNEEENEATIELPTDRPPQLSTPEPAQLTSSTVSEGYSESLQETLQKAKADLDAGRIAEFIAQMMPPVYQLNSPQFRVAIDEPQANPELFAAMQADLAAMLEMEPELNADQTVATFRFKRKPLTVNAGTVEIPDRVVQLEKSGDRWRFTDHAQKISELMQDFSDDAPPEIQSQAAAVVLEKIGSDWRLKTMPSTR